MIVYRGAIALALSGLTAAFAQTAGAELAIELRDPSGAAVAASGKLVNQLTGFVHVFEADAGVYEWAGLAQGRYRLEVTKDGFAGEAMLIVLDSSGRTQRTVRMRIGVAAFRVDVVGETPLPGAGRAVDDIAGAVQTASARDIASSGALDLSYFLNRRMNGVHLNEIQGNPLQADLNYRGYTASPLLGTPQGVSVYMDGVRLNQPFGDVVSWDLIPRQAIAEASILPGSNPLFGLNTLGGAVSLRSKDGLSDRHTSLQLGGGSFARKMAEFEHGGTLPKGFHAFVAANLFFEDGWRESSPSNVRQFFGKLGWQGQRSAFTLSAAYVNNSLIGNGLQEQRFLDRDFRSVYTKPDLTANRSPFMNLTVRRTLANRVTFSGNAYFRQIQTRTLNGDINEESLDQALYQPNADEQDALAAAGYTGFPTSGENASNTPFPFWRCIANGLLQDEPSEKCNGLLNRGSTRQNNFGLAGQFHWSAPRLLDQFTLGGAYDGNSAGFAQSSELGYLKPDRSVTGIAAFGDGVTGGEADGEPFDTRVDLSSGVHSGSVYATGAKAFASRFRLNLSGRYNRTSVDNLDRILPVAGTGSLTGLHVFQRFNPAVGLTYRPGAAVNLYAGYSEGSRAPTAIELGCADPATPCKLPNALAGDPPLEQVVTRTLEAGVRGSAEPGLQWSAGWFRADNRNDILFVASPQTGFGYFKNFGRTLRQGMELDVKSRFRRLSLGAGYTFLDATFQSAEEVNGSGNSTNEEAHSGVPGTDGTIDIDPGNRIPLLPRHLVKAYADLQVTSRLLVDAGFVGVSSSFARGNENNLHAPDDTYYLGPGSSPGYGVVNCGARYRIHSRVELYIQANNLFDRRYFTAAQLGPTGFTGTGNFIARPFPAIDGEFPVQQATFYAPGAPRAAWAGVRVYFRP